jgi:fatty acid desaturase
VLQGLTFSHLTQHRPPLVCFIVTLLTRCVMCCAVPCCVPCCAVLQGLTYDQAQATINGTVSVQLPHWLEVLLHHSNHHLPAHVSISIPSYNLPAAQVSTKPVSASAVGVFRCSLVSMHSGDCQSLLVSAALIETPSTVSGVVMILCFAQSPMQ